MTVDELEKTYCEKYGTSYSWNFTDEELTSMISFQVVINLFPDDVQRRVVSWSFYPDNFYDHYHIFKNPTDKWDVYFVEERNGDKMDDFNTFDDSSVAFIFLLSRITFSRTREEIIDTYQKIVNRGFSNETLTEYYENYFGNSKRVNELENNHDFTGAHRLENEMLENMRTEIKRLVKEYKEYDSRRNQK